MKQQCLEQFESVHPEAHHRLTLRFLDPACPGSLRPEVDKLRDDGSGMSEKLLAAVRCLQGVPLDDSICEGPHAQAKRLKMPASAAKWAWIAASMRLGQNITDCQELPKETSTSLRAVWSGFSTVIQRASKATVVPRIKYAQFQRLLYRLDHLLDFQVQGGLPAEQAALEGDVARKALPPPPPFDAGEGEAAASDDEVFGGGDPEPLRQLGDEASNKSSPHPSLRALRNRGTLPIWQGLGNPGSACVEDHFCRNARSLWIRPRPRRASGAIVSGPL